MKTMIQTGLLLLAIIWLVSTNETQAQCTNCPQSTTNNSNSSAIGINNHASGHASFVSGMNSNASGMLSTTLGSYSDATGDYSMVFGFAGKATATKSMVIGHGYDFNPGDFLVNPYPYSLMIGFGSTKPTLFVSTSYSRYTTGSIGIGDVTDPQAKLHIRADDGEEAALLIEPGSWMTGSTAKIQIGNESHGIEAHYPLGLMFKTETNYLFNEGRLGLNTYSPKYMLHVNGNMFTRQFRLYDSGNMPEDITGWILRSDSEGNALWSDPSLLQDSDWEIDGENIYRLDGNVGIGTKHTYEYRLAVNGKIITEEVVVKFEENWPDYVFDTDHETMSIPEVEAYIQENNHLPGVPSANEVQQNGVKLGEMDGILLKKVEELTLYIIEQQKEIEALKSEVQTLKAE